VDDVDEEDPQAVTANARSAAAAVPAEALISACRVGEA
jgi:hypothetical protein